MKGYSAAAAPPPKRRWKGRASTVLALVFVSLLVPLVFLLGLQNRLPSGYFTEDRSPAEFGFGSDRRETTEGQPSRINKLVKKTEKTAKLSKDVNVSIITQPADKNSHKKTDGESTSNGKKFALQPINTTLHSEPMDTTSHSEPKNFTSYSKGAALSTPQIASSKPFPVHTRNNGKNRKQNYVKGSPVDDTTRSCQLEFGSYCLWSAEHKEVMKDSTVKRLKDQLFVARAYYPSVLKLQAQENLSQELKQNIQEYEHMLSAAISDDDLPKFLQSKIEKMDQTIARAKTCTVDCNNVDKKLRQILDLTEDEARFHMKQGEFLYHLGVQTIPKSLHCLSLRLTVEYFRSPSVASECAHTHKLDNPSFRHHIIFSKNMLAASVAINSTVMSSKETENMVFHLLTDIQNYYAMRLWFSRISYKDAVVCVLNFDELSRHYGNKLGKSQMTMSEEFRVSIRNIDQSLPEMGTKYISTFGHSHFLLPDIFKNLRKVVVLDDDVVVQRDLSSLWNIDLKGKVNGAVEFCGVRMGQLKRYLGSTNYDANSCIWMSGLNIIDLEKWREHDITGKYQQLLQKFHSRNDASWRAAALPTSLLAFQSLTYPLDNTWTVSGLGHDYGVSVDTIKKVAVLHYNGNMKPWLDLGIAKHKRYWKTFLTREMQFMDDCNVNP